MSNDDDRPIYHNLNIMCDQKHDDWLEYIWHTQTLDSFHNSQHLFDPYSIVHFLSGAILFYILMFVIANKNTNLVIAIFILVLYEIDENRTTNIFKYNIASGTFGYKLKSKQNIPFKYEKNGKIYNFMNKNSRIYMITSKGKIIKEVKIEELNKYGVPVYKGDSYLNILGDILSGVLGVLLVYTMISEKSNGLILIMFTAILLLIDIMIPHYYDETINDIILQFKKI